MSERLTRITNVAGGVRTGRGSRLRVIAGPDAGLEVALPPVGLVLGADPVVDVPLRYDAVSRRHVAVVPSGGGFEVRDLDSKNGTLVDGVSLSRAIVPVGAVLRLGRTLVQLMPAEETIDLPPSAASSFGGMVGGSLAMRRVYAVLERASGSDAAVLLTGESGTGKELAARAIHDASPRRDGPFVVFDCGAAADNLIESALFGHLRGAFTGATGDRTGAFAAAHRGTLFLDELGDLPAALQPKLLRLLEAGEVTPLGSTRGERFDVRVVAATHHDLYDEVGRGVFRGDLYYRLAVVEVHLPPLRQRLDDLPVLIEQFLARSGRPATVATGSSNLGRLMAYRWPGNVRELRNVMARAVALGGPAAGFDELPIVLRGAVGGDAPVAAPVVADRPFNEAKAEVVARFEEAYLRDLLARAGGNLSQAARHAGLERKFLYRLLERAGLRDRKPADATDEPADDD
jgi:DNA-binding NtrC family response regulator